MGYVFSCFLVKYVTDGKSRNSARPVRMDGSIIMLLYELSSSVFECSCAVVNKHHVIIIIISSSSSSSSSLPAGVSKQQDVHV